MLDTSDRLRVKANQTFVKPKRIGGYLIDAGLLTLDQVNVVLNDQRATGMRFGEILVARGWLKEQTIEWVMEKVVIPEKKAFQRKQEQTTVNQERTIHQQRPSGAAAQDKKASSKPPQASTAPSHPSQTTIPGNIIQDTHSSQSHITGSAFVRREVPIAKPLPPVKSPDGDVNWVG
jgi:hypothetical protein